MLIGIIIAMKKIQNTKNILENQQGMHFVLIIESIIVGMLAGLVIVFFRKGIKFCNFWMTSLYNKISTENITVFFLTIAVLLSLAIFIGYLIKKFPMIVGSGVSQLKGNFLQKMPFLPLAELPLKFIAGIITIGSGMSVGKAGPSIQIGAYLGSVFERIGKTSHIEKVCLITSGATAGLSAIFGAPFASMLFAIEGLHQYLSPLLLICTMAGAFSGNFVVSLFFGNKPMFDISGLGFFPMKYYAWLIVLGILTAVLAYIFKKTIYLFQKAFKKISIVELRPIIPFLVILPIYFFFPLASGSGDKLVFDLINNNYSLQLLCLILIVKIIFTGLCLGSGAIGGVFFPLLACGALSGILFSQILVYFNLIEEQYAMNLMIFGMTGFFTGVINAPMTGIILLAEIGADFAHLDGIIICGLTAYIFGNFLNSKPELSENISIKEFIPESELSKIEQNKKKSKIIKRNKQNEIFEFFVFPESKLVAKKVSEINLPDSCLLVSIARADEEIIPKASDEIFAGDRLIFISSFDEIDENIAYLYNFT